MQHHPVIQAAISRVAGACFTEADESRHGDPVVAYANHRFQLYMGETHGVVDMYEEAALRCGVPRSALERDRFFLRATVAGISEDEARQMAISLNNDVLLYLAKEISETELRKRQFLNF